MEEDIVLKDVNHIHPLPDFVEGGLAYLPYGNLDDKENFVKIMKIFLDRLSFVDQKMVELAEMRTLLNAENENLDEIGRQLGILRNGLEDPEYRAVITILSGGNAKSGTRTDIISTLRQIFGDDNFTTYKGYNYRFDINVYDSCMEVMDILPQILEMLPLVTHLRLVEADGYPFGFEGDKQSFGWASVHDDIRNGAGGMASLTYTSEQEEAFFG